jgi:small glutamine-rich tetratricopeptide repeat-containing protein alpha
MGGMADVLKNLGGEGGMPSMEGLMQNPMMMQMAQQMMANGGLESLMSNPSVANMVGYLSAHLSFVCLFALFRR